MWGFRVHNTTKTNWHDKRQVSSVWSEMADTNKDSPVQVPAPATSTHQHIFCKTIIWELTILKIFSFPQLMTSDDPN